MRVGRVVRVMLRETITLTVATASEPCFVEASRAQLSEALIQDALDAERAMPRGGDLTISVETVETSAGPHACLLMAAPGAGKRFEILLPLVQG